MFHRITQFIQRHLPVTISKKHIGIFLVLSTFVGVMLFGLSTQSVSAIDSFNVRDGVLEFFTKICIVLARLAMAFAIFFLRFFIQLAAYNGYLDAPIVRLGWVMLRDIGNMFFVVALLVIAFATILGRESYEWKKAMVKLVLVAIVVNFSLLICGLVLDAAHVFTVTFVNAIAPVAAGNLIEMFNFNEMERIITDTGTEGSPDLKLALFGGAAVALGFSVMAAIAIGAYCIVLLFRMVSIWALLIFSPLAFILSVLPATENYFEEWKSEFTKYVLSAPIAVFFLWLAFATMSANGGIVKHLDTFSSGNTIGDISQDSTGAGDQVVQVAQDNAVVNSVSLNVASTWANMAGFLVALAFLLKGIEQVQSLGVAGAGWLDSASSFAKTAVTIGSGYAFGRWLVGKGVDGLVEGSKAAAGGVFERIPFVGGAALREQKARLAHHFTEKGILGVGGVRRKIKNSERAAELEKMGGAWNTFKARWVEPAERASKRAQDWEKAAENLHHIQEEKYSTSASDAGQAKLNTNQEKESVEHDAHAKGAEKMAARTEMLLELAHSYDHQLDALAQTQGVKKEDLKLTKKQEEALREKAREDYLDKVEQKNGGGSADPEEQRKAKKEREKTKTVIEQNGLDKLVRLGMNMHKAHIRSAQSQAAADEASEPERRQVEMMSAQARDDIRIKKGLAPVHVARILDKQNKELEDTKSALNYREITKQAASYMAAGGTDTVEKARESAALLTASLKRGRDTGMTAYEGMLGELGMTADYNATRADDLEGQQRLMMSVLLGRNISRTELPGAITEFHKKVGGKDVADAILKNLDTGIKVAAADGALNLAGLFDDKVGADKKLTFELQDHATAAGQDAFKGQRATFSGQMEVNKLESVKNMIDNGGNAVTSLQAKAQMTDFFSSIQGNSNPKAKLIKDIQRLWAIPMVRLQLQRIMNANFSADKIKIIKDKLQLS